MQVQLIMHGAPGYALPASLAWRARAAWLQEVACTTISGLHRQVSAALTSLGIPHQNEVITPDGLFSVDIVLEGPSHMAIEVDGPQHFACNTLKELGKTLSPISSVAICFCAMVQLRSWCSMWVLWPVRWCLQIMGDLRRLTIVTGRPHTVQTGDAAGAGLAGHQLTFY